MKERRKLKIPRGYRSMPPIGPPNFDKFRDEVMDWVGDEATKEQLHKLCTLLEQVHAEYWRHILEEHGSN